MTDHTHQSWISSMCGLAPILIAMLLIGCGGDKPQHVDASINYYTYTAFDPDDQPIIQGRLTFAGPMNDAGKVQGTWHLVRTKVATTALSGGLECQTGDGEILGSIDGEKVMLNLNQNVVDNNVIILGTIHDDQIAGQWEYSTIAGAKVYGRVTITRRYHSNP